MDLMLYGSFLNRFLSLPYCPVSFTETTAKNVGVAKGGPKKRTLLMDKNITKVRT